MFCDNCGKQLSDKARFCTGCGTKTEVAQAPIIQPEPQPQPQQQAVTPPVQQEVPPSPSDTEVNVESTAKQIDKGTREKVSLVLSYAVIAWGGVTGLIILLLQMKKYDLVSTLGTVDTVLYWLISIGFLVWMYFVHVELNSLFSGYKTKPAKVVWVSFIPIYNLIAWWGIFSEMIDKLADEKSDYLPDGEGAKRVLLPILFGLLIAWVCTSCAVQLTLDDSFLELIMVIVVLGFQGIQALLWYGVIKTVNGALDDKLNEDSFHANNQEV